MANRFQVKVSAWLIVDANTEDEAQQFTFSTEEVERLVSEQGQDFDIGDPLPACARCGETVDYYTANADGEPDYCSEECEKAGPLPLGASVA